MQWNTREHALMAKAVACAMRSLEPNRHGCVVASKRKVLGRGWNKNKTHPAANQTYSKCIHAELAALIGVNTRDLRGVDLFVARVMRTNGEFIGMSRPCKTCMDMILRSGIRRIYYTVQTETPTGAWKVIKL